MEASSQVTLVGITEDAFINDPAVAEAIRAGVAASSDLITGPDRVTNLAVADTARRRRRRLDEGDGSLDITYDVRIVLEEHGFEAPASGDEDASPDASLRFASSLSAELVEDMTESLEEGTFTEAFVESALEAEDSETFAGLDEDAAADFVDEESTVDVLEEEGVDMVVEVHSIPPADTPRPTHAPVPAPSVFVPSPTSDDDGDGDGAPVSPPTTASSGLVAIAAAIFVAVLACMSCILLAVWATILQKRRANGGRGGTAGYTMELGPLGGGGGGNGMQFQPEPPLQQPYDYGLQLPGAVSFTAAGARSIAGSTRAQAAVAVPAGKQVGGQVAKSTMF